MSVDPSPSKADLGIKESPKPAVKVKVAGESDKQSRYDTILQFAAIELEGIIQKKST